MAPSPVPQWLSDSPGKTCHCHRVLLLGKANPERTHQGEAVSVLAAFLLLCHHHPRCPFFSSASTWPALVPASGAAPACLSPPDWLLPPKMGCVLLFWAEVELGIYSWETAVKSGVRITQVRHCRCVCVSSSCMTNAVLSSLGKLARAPDILTCFSYVSKKLLQCHYHWFLHNAHQVDATDRRGLVLYGGQKHGKHFIWKNNTMIIQELTSVYSQL